MSDPHDVCPLTMMTSWSTCNQDCTQDSPDEVQATSLVDMLSITTDTALCDDAGHSYSLVSLFHVHGCITQYESAPITTTTGMLDKYYLPDMQKWYLIDARTNVSIGLRRIEMQPQQSY